MGKRRVEKIDLDSHEQAVLEQRISELAEHLSLVRDAYNLIGKTVTALPESPSVLEMPLSRRVGEVLLCRIGNDLRSATHLATRGYGLQAMVLISSVFEMAFTVAYTNDDEKRAADWSGHEDPTRSFRSIGHLLSDVLKDEPANVGTNELKCYAQLCMAKHGNPLLQKSHGVRESAKQIEVFMGPDASEHDLQLAWYALQNGVRLASIAAARFARSHVPEARWPRAEYDRIIAALTRLSAAAIARGWAEDPFPEKWREFKK